MPVMMCGHEAEKEMSRDGSHYSLSSGILPSLGAMSNRRIKLRRFIVSPYERRYRLLFLNLFFFFLPFCFSSLERDHGGAVRALS